MKIIVGLGNPGEQYQKTRHNVGEFYLAKLAQTWGVKDFEDAKSADYAEVKIKGGSTSTGGRTSVMLIFPKEHMNNSGPALKKALAQLKIKTKPQDILVIHDDLDIDFGRIKLSFAKSSAGHKGVESVIKNLKSDKFWRLRIGIRPKKKPEHKKIVDFLLKKFTPAEEKILNKNFKKIKSGLEAWVNDHDQASILINTLNYQG
ncbi:MAG: aminoacyl-tRNA hydrolase [Parcubacteria group bacterium]|nr:aminoacyl-tRNA hydrolase [Parcubacteria group bacterium]